MGHERARAKAVYSPEAVSAQIRKAARRERFFHYFVIREGKYTYLKKREAKDIWHGMFEFPMVEGTRSFKRSELLKSKEVATLLGKVKEMDLTAILQQTLTHQKIKALFYMVELYNNPKNKNLAKVSTHRLREYAVPGIISDYLKLQSKA